MSLLSKIKRFLPIALLLAGLALALAMGWHNYLSFENLRENREVLLDWVSQNGALAALALILLYGVVVAFSLPVGSAMTLAAGFLFGTWLGGSLVVVGATLGATAVFLAARTAIGDALKKKAGPAVQRMEAGFKDNEVSYMLILRLVPLFPFWLVNLVPAFLGVRLRTYVLATFFGIIPGSFVYASVGAGLGQIFDRGQAPDLSLIYDLRILLPLLALVLLAAVPIAYKRLKRRQKTLTES